jgi:hypothetical protein
LKTIRLEGNVLKEGGLGLRVIALFRVHHSQVEVYERQLRVGLGGAGQLFESIVVRFLVKLRLAEQKVQFCGALPHLHQSGQCAFPQFLAFRFVCGDA